MSRRNSPQDSLRASLLREQQAIWKNSRSGQDAQQRWEERKAEIRSFMANDTMLPDTKMDQTRRFAAQVSNVRIWPYRKAGLGMQEDTCRESHCALDGTLAIRYHDQTCYPTTIDTTPAPEYHLRTISTFSPDSVLFELHLWCDIPKPS
nr:hypothetical protein B0A51_17750 [Rachicladosporium sp. CCFEE 5018]